VQATLELSPSKSCLTFEKSCNVFSLRTSKPLVTNQYMVFIYLTFKLCSCKEILWHTVYVSFILLSIYYGNFIMATLLSQIILWLLCRSNLATIGYIWLWFTRWLAVNSWSIEYLRKHSKFHIFVTYNFLCNTYILFVKWFYCSTITTMILDLKQN